MNVDNKNIIFALLLGLPIINSAAQSAIYIDATPTTINIHQGKEAQGVVLTNYDSIDALGLKVNIPQNSAITLDKTTTTCTCTLPANSRCLYSFSAGNKIESTFITINGANMNPITITANVVPPNS